MSETARFVGDQEYQGGDLALLFQGPNAPPLEGEEVCICGRPEGEHDAFGACPASRCEYFVSENGEEEQTRPDIVVEYEPGCEPATGAR